MPSDTSESSTAVAINEVQLLLAEKRTALAVMRTGIAVLALPLSILSLLVATSKYYDPQNVLHFLIPLAAVLLSLIVLGGYLIIRSMRRMAYYDHLVHTIKRKHSVIAEFVD